MERLKAVRPSPYERHRELLQQAVRALAAGECRRPFTEATGQDAADAGMRSVRTAVKVFGSLLGRPFELDQPGELGRVCTESSPYGIGMGIGYPRCDPAALVAAAAQATAGWRVAGPHRRAGLAVEILRRLNTRSHELALAVHHTTGQPPQAAFRSAGPRAQDRALEAVALAFAESERVPADLSWESGHGTQGSGQPSPMRGTSTLVPRGVSLLIGCPDYPLWNGYPGLFASLVTGNPVIVAPHPRSVLPLAITVRVARQVLAEDGLPPDIVTLAVAAPAERLHERLATDPEVRIVDFTGSAQFAGWLKEHARQAATFVDRTGLNTVIVDSTGDYRDLVRGLAHSLCRCSGTVRTTPQNILVPTTGIATDEGRKSLGDFGADLGEAVDRLLGHPARVARLLGAIASDTVRAGLAEATRYGTVLHASGALRHPNHPAADVRSPLLVRLAAQDERIYAREWPGPVSFLVGTDSTSHSLALFRRTVGRHGASYATVHSTDPLVLAVAETAALDAGVHLVQNLADDFPADPSSAGADLPCEGAHFVTGRFRVVRSRQHAAGTAPAPVVEAAPRPTPIGAAESPRAPAPDAGSAAALVDV
ncbi:aldehyde dehydrogenase family protein [Streptomyces virginiae]|uniref:aldehyde dehydrogenase family protein n=1 Tax=Streptomyces virginiae TaxID=1961 RepID=UPI0036E5746B